MELTKVSGVFIHVHVYMNTVSELNKARTIKNTGDMTYCSLLRKVQEFTT